MPPKVKIRPSLWYCLLGLPFLLAGGGIALYWMLDGLGELTDAMTQVVVPGSAELSLVGGETYTVFLERETVVNGIVFSVTREVTGLKCTVAAPDGRDVPVVRPSGTTTYTYGGRSGRSVLEFHTDVDGVYTFRCGYAQGEEGPRTVMSVGAGFGKNLMALIFKVMGASFGGLGVCVLIVVVVLVLRDRDEKRHWAELYPQ